MNVERKCNRCAGQVHVSAWDEHLIAIPSVFSARVARMKIAAWLTQTGLKLSSCNRNFLLKEFVQKAGLKFAM